MVEIAPKSRCGMVSQGISGNCWRADEAAPPADRALPAWVALSSVLRLRPESEAACPWIHDPLSGVRDGYDRWASVYDHDANPLPALEDPHVREALGDVRGLEVLDLGCGTGRHTAWLAEAGARVTAVDFSENMLERARVKVSAADVRFVVHDLHEPLPLDDASFDAHW